MGVLGDAGLKIPLPEINWAQAAMNVMFYGLIVIIIIVGLAWMVVSFKNKKIYIHPITLVNLRANGKKTRTDLMGGIVSGPSGIKDYKIRVPKVWKKKALGYIPDFSLADADDRLTFIQDGDGTMWQQCKTTLITEKNMEVEVPIEGDKEGRTEKKNLIYSLLIEPIPTDVKTVTYNNMQNVRALIDKNKLTAFGITVIGFVIMVIAHLISLYIQTKIKCPIPG